MDELKLWALLYKEICELFVAQLQSIEWIDLWHNQVGFLEDEHPFPTPAAFLAFRILGEPQDLGINAQRIVVQLDVYFFYETFLDTFDGGYNQEGALTYLNTITDIHALLHGSSGINYSECKRVGFGPVDTGSAGNLYRQTFTMLVEDASASPDFVGMIPGDVSIEQGGGPDVEIERPFVIPSTT
ncbi:hypothetical protein [Allomuricauda sp. M10]|uniref:hypothetical protein n=1 Tax=Allomuricauda sp. M10 TaxID=2683292 RepID=UPI001D180CA2|nr:hypothetical protein [Muricauda sp. M10]